MRYRLTAFAVVVIAASFVSGAVGAAPQGGVAVSLSAAQTEFGASQDVLVTVTVSNPTQHTIRILRWFTPVDGIEEPLFAITRDGHPVAYLGAHYKRPAITGKDYLSLKAGESVTSVVDLGASYDLSGTGRYEVAYRASSAYLFDERGSSRQLDDTLVSEKVALKVVGRASKGKPSPPPPPPPSGGNTFTACTTAQQSALVSARALATTYASGSLGYLNAGTQGPRYTTWFGVYSATRYTTVKTHFGAISSAMANAGISFDCSSKQNVYAYVYPNQPYRIYLGRVYWTAPAGGTDSQAGTLIHEMSHFTVVAGTDDVVYGQTGAKNLAITNPDAAVTNADSHEYFAENTPSLP